MNWKVSPRPISHVPNPIGFQKKNTFAFNVSNEPGNL